MKLDSTYKLAIVVGHEKLAKGAKLGAPLNTNEYDFNKGIAQLTYVFARDKSIDARIFYRDGIGIRGVGKAVTEWKADACIELHCNSATPAAYGTETLYDLDPPNSKKLAEHVQAAMCGVFKRQGKGDRGIKLLKEGDRGHYNLLGYKCAAVLVEPFFGSSLSDCKIAWGVASGYSRCLVTSVIAYFNQLEGEKENAK